MNRRSFLRLAGVGAAAAFVPGCLRQTMRLGRRPNILFCISDDQTFAHAGAYGCTFVETPAFDRIAHEGILFRNAFVSAPSCCPSRASALTGLPFYRLKETSMNHTFWANGLRPYPDILAAAGYHIGYTGKGWGPGNWKVAGRVHNPAGVQYNQIENETPSSQISPIDYASNFEAFLEARPSGAPFCFWYGGIDPHRIYEAGSGLANGKRLDEIDVPPFFPDARLVRSDIADYALHIDWFDKHLGRMIATLEARGELNNTLIVVTSDNGMPFPRCKATLYDWGTHMPLAIRWGAKVRPQREVDDFVSFIDFAPTFLEAAGVPVPMVMEGKSLMPLLTSDESGAIDPKRDHVVMGVERHFPGGRETGDPYPMRAIRTSQYLYIHNTTPVRWPAGDPDGPVWPDDDPTGGFGDSDGGPTKTFIVQNKDRYPWHFKLAFGKRPAEELYDVKADPHQLNDLADDPQYASVKRGLRRRLDRELRQTRDPRTMGKGEFFDRVAREFDDDAKSAALSR